MNYKSLLVMLTAFYFVAACSVTNADSSEIKIRPDSWAKPVINSELENFYQVDQGVYRSEQPDDDAFEELEQYGITDVLNLRNYHSDDDEAEDTDIRLHRVEMNAGSITEQQILRALAIIKARNGPIVFHCWHGSDRTGAVSAAYRVIFQNWTKQQAIEELRRGGFGYHESFYPNVIKLIENLDVSLLKEKLDLEG